jgi:DNA-3-methyladenine glycosylase
MPFPRKRMRARPPRLPQSFFERATRQVAQSLLGKVLVSLRDGELVAGRIVETEAYLGKDDPACHAARGMTPRNEVMFRSGGYCYVYLIYGMYHCVNVVTERAGFGSAVLIRAVEPLEGLDVMGARRGRACRRMEDLARGPGRLCQAFAIGRDLSGAHYGDSREIWLEDGQPIRRADIGSSGRIGIREGEDLQLRFYEKSSPFASGRR